MRNVAMEAEINISFHFISSNIFTMLLILVNCNCLGQMSFTENNMPLRMFKNKLLLYFEYACQLH